MAQPTTLGFMRLFAGLQTRYSTGSIVGKNINGKMELRYKSETRQVSEEVWEDHLEGKIWLGIYPHLENDTCNFGAIDIDVYPMDLEALARQVAQEKLPLVVCRTKSDGARLFLFLSKPVKCSYVRGRLEQMATLLGYSGTEVFPKQGTISHKEREAGAVGSCLNMPYRGNTQEVCIGPAGNQLTAEEFLDYARHSFCSQEDLKALRLDPPELLEGAPPCLQQLCKAGFPNGTRNNGMFNLGVYAKKAFQEKWQSKMHEWNEKYMQPPLADTEILGAAKSLAKEGKEYFYTCNQQPIQSFCNKTLCRQCKFGIGGEGRGLPVMRSLTKIETDPPMWFLDVEGLDVRVEMETQDLLEQGRFKSKMLEALHVVVRRMKQEAWDEMLDQLMKDIQVVKLPPEMKQGGDIWEWFELYCTQNCVAEHRDHVENKPVLWEGHVYFKTINMMEFMVRKGVKLPRHKILAILRNRGVEFSGHVWRVKGRGVAVAKAPQFKRDVTPLSVPDNKPEGGF